MLPRDFRDWPESCSDIPNPRGLLRDYRLLADGLSPSALHAVIAAHRRHHLLAYCLLQPAILKPGLCIPYVSWWDPGSIPQVQVHSTLNHHHQHQHQHQHHQRSFNDHTFAFYGQGYFSSVILSGSSIVTGYGVPPHRGMDTRWVSNVVEWKFDHGSRSRVQRRDTFGK